MKKMFYDNSGNSFVEILVGFVLIMIFIAGFYEIIRLSSNMTMLSADREQDRRSYEENYFTDYENNFESETITEKGRITMRECDCDGNVLPGSGKAYFSLNRAKLIRIYEKAGKMRLGIDIYRLIYEKK